MLGRSDAETTSPSVVGQLASGILTTASIMANGLQATAAQLANGFDATATQFAGLAEQLRGGRSMDQPMLMEASGPYEQLLVRDSSGSGTVRVGIDGRIHFIINARVVDLFGADDGSYEAAYFLRQFRPEDIIAWPDPARPPFDRPFRPDDAGWDPVLNLTKARFAFRDSGEVFCLGPGLSRIAAHRDGAPQFWFAVAGFITGGSGEYDGCIGQLTSLASTHFTSTPAPVEGVTFDVRVFHVLKVLRRQSRAPAR